MFNTLRKQIMQDYELNKELEKKRLRNVKQANPTLKKTIVSIINFSGKVLFSFRRNKLPDEVRKILFVSLYFNGDILFHSVFFEMVRRLYPEAKLHLWIKSRTKAMMDGYPYFDKIYFFDDIKTRKYDEKVNFDLRKKLRFFKELKKEKYDIAFDLTGLFWTAFAMWYSGAKYLSGFNFQGFGFFYNFESESVFSGHLIDKHTRIIKNNPVFKNALKSKVQDVLKPTYKISKESVIKIDNLFNSATIGKQKKIIILHTTAGWEAKKWGIENFIMLARMLKDKYDVVIIGGIEDAENGKIITENVNHGVTDFSGKLTINQSAEVIRRAALYIGADSGPLYLAEAVGTRTLSLFGPTNPLFSAPKGSQHTYIYKEMFCSAEKNVQNCKLLAGLNCGTIDCMKMIKPEEVYEFAEKMTKSDEY